MTKTCLIFLAGFFLQAPILAGSVATEFVINQQPGEPERLMNLFLKNIQSNDANEVNKFIRENYSESFLSFPMEAHRKVIDQLHKDFSSHVIMRKETSSNTITVTIRSAVNKTREITLQTDGRRPAKIMIIEVSKAD